MGARVTEGINPWLSRPVMPEPDTTTATEALSVPPTGPVAPQRGIPAPDQADQLPTYARTHTADLWFVGTHGGAGESTLAALVPGWAPAGHGWPLPPGHEQARIVLTARSSMHGLRSAQIAATQWAAGLVPRAQVLGLVVIADAPGRLPRPLREFTQIVGGGLPRTWTVPWVEAWRLGETPNLATAPRDVRRLVEDLTALL